MNALVEVLPTLPYPDNPKYKMTLIGHLDGHPHCLVVSIPPNGATRFYCDIHHIIFWPISSCPMCRRSGKEFYDET